MLCIPESIEGALIVLQATSFCNLNCSYCYVPERKNKASIPIALFEETVKKIFDSSVFKNELRFLWHSGEPLVAGLDYFDECLNILNRLRPKSMTLNFEVQTNATLVNSKWIDFFKTHQFHVGVSIDGPDFLHDACRKTWNKKNTHHLSLKGLKMIQDAGLNYGVICVLTAESLNYPTEIFNFFHKENVVSLCFNVEEKDGDNNSSSMIDDKSVTISDKYRKFIETIYDCWELSGKSMEIREIKRMNNSIAKKITQPNYIASSQEVVPYAIVSVSRDGDISFFSPELLGGISENRKKFVLTNIRDINTFNEIVDLDSFKHQFDEIKTGVEMCLQTCEYYDMCGGGSPSNKFAENGTFASSQTQYCVLQQKLLTEIFIEKMSKSPLGMNI